MASFLLITFFVTTAQALSTQQIEFIRNGAALIPVGKIIIDHNYILIPSSLQLGNFTTWFENMDESECGGDLHRKGSQIQHQLETMIKANIGSLYYRPQSKSRSKRFAVGSILLGLGAGFMGNWIYDSITSHNTQKAITQVEHHIDEILQAVSELHHDALIQNSNVKHIWSHSLKNREDLRQLKGALQCLRGEVNMNSIASILYSTIPNQFHRALSAILDGKLTPDVLGYNQAYNVILHHPDLRSSAYVTQLQFFYHATHTIPVHVDASKGTIVYLLRIPLLKPQTLGDLYQLYNFGAMNGSLHRRLALPSFFGLFKDTYNNPMIYEIDLTRCKQSTTVYLCRESAISMTVKNQCVEDIWFSKGTKRCATEVKTPIYDPLVLDTGDGVFIASVKYPITLYNQTGDQKTSRVVEPNKTHSTRWFPYAAFDGLVVGQYHLSGDTDRPNPITSSDIVIMVNATLNITEIVSDDWAPEDIFPVHIPSWSSSTLIPVWQSIVVSIITYVALSVIIIIYVMRRRTIRRRQVEAIHLA